MKNNEKLLATVEVPSRENAWGNDSCQLYAKFPKFRKWWKFWEDNYEEVPLKIVNLTHTVC